MNKLVKKELDKMQHKKHYFHSDGNGGYAIGKITLGIIVSLFTIIGFLVAPVFNYGKLNNQVENINDKLNAQGIIINNLQDNQSDYDVRLVILEQNILNVKKDIQDIKINIAEMQKNIEDIKIMLQNVNNK